MKQTIDLPRELIHPVSYEPTIELDFHFHFKLK